MLMFSCFRQIGAADTLGKGVVVLVGLRHPRTTGELVREGREILRTLVFVADIRFIIAQFCPRECTT